MSKPTKIFINGQYVGEASGASIFHEMNEDAAEAESKRRIKEIEDDLRSRIKQTVNDNFAGKTINEFTVEELKESVKVMLNTPATPQHIEFKTSVQGEHASWGDKEMIIPITANVGRSESFTRDKLDEAMRFMLKQKYPPPEPQPKYIVKRGG